MTKTNVSLTSDNRLLSLDFFRGFTMLLIIGGARFLLLPISPLIKTFFGRVEHPDTILYKIPFYGSCCGISAIGCINERYLFESKKNLRSC